MKMQRFAPYLGIVATLFIGVFIATLSEIYVVENSSTTIVIPDLSSAPAVEEFIATTTLKESIESIKEIVVPKIVPQKTEESELAANPVEQISLSPENISPDDSSSALRSALVNIICMAPIGVGLNSISGSGVIIDPKGIIITNAHIAQYFLLENKNVSCVIRSGSPAIEKYKANLIYISPEWLISNPDVLTKSNPSGTGEYDFAFLAISKSSTNNSLPSSFPYIPLASVSPLVGTPVVIASYGAQFLESAQIQFDLFPTIVFGSIKDLFTFKTNTVDVLALGGSAAAQVGSSGGGVANFSGDLVGIITTSTVTGTTDTRSLSAITASYVRAQYATETGQPLDFLLSKSTEISISDFAPQIPGLEAIIIKGLP